MASITPRKNKDGSITSYTIRVYHGYDGSGKRLKPYTMSYKPAPGMTTRQIEKEVQRQALKFEEQIKNGYAIDNRQTFAEYSEYVLKCKEENGIKHRTIERYRELLLRINAGIGHIKLADLRPQHLSAFYSQLRQAGVRKGNGRAFPAIDIKIFAANKGMTKEMLSKQSGVSLTTLTAVFNSKHISEKGAKQIAEALSAPVGMLFKIEEDNRPLSEKTVQEHHRLISTILSQAEKEMLIPYNPAEKVVNKPKAERKQEVNYFELSELEHIRECLNNSPLKWRVITHLLIVTGCRRGEIAGLKWSAVDFERRELHICNNLLYSKEWGVYEDTTKTATSDRIVTLPHETMSLLREYRDYWEQTRALFGSKWNSFLTIKDGNGIEQTEKADFLFIREDGDKAGYPMHPDSITDWLNKFSERNELPHINPHAFRHTLASVLCLNGVDMTTISKWLGHKSVSTTMSFYEHILDKGRERVVDCVSDVILNSGSNDKAEKKA